MSPGGVKPAFLVAVGVVVYAACHSSSSTAPEDYDSPNSAAIKFQNTVVVPLTLSVDVDGTRHSYVVEPGKLTPAVIVSAAIPGVRHKFTLTYTPAVAECDEGWCEQPVVFEYDFVPGNRGEPGREDDGSVIFFAPPKPSGPCPVGYICYWVPW